MEHRTRRPGARRTFSASKPGFRGGSRRGGPQRGGGSFGGRSRFGGSRGGSRRRGRGGSKIDISKFINKVSDDVVVEEEVFTPVHKFNDFALDARIKQNIEKKGFVNPTPIQDQSIPVILDGKDIVGIANTGTGKTGAFLLPLVDKVLKNKKEKVLIMAPTRELAIQIDEEFRLFAQRLYIFSAICVGGAPIGKQLSDLRRGANFVIGTPGRIKDLIERKAIVPSQYNTVVLDEADRMLDMGFIGDMRSVLSKMPTPRHTLFFSATLSPDIEKLISEFLTDEVRISVKTRDTAASIDQDIVRVAGKDKMEVLHNHLSDPEFEKVIVFGRTKHGVEKISKQLSARGHKSQSIHGNKSHGQRQRSLKAFKNNHSNVLVATDVAARGLDISDVSHVINYDIPETYEDYVHRIGRTGRGGKKGKAITFID